MKIKQLSAIDIKQGGKEYWGHPKNDSIYNGSCVVLSWHVVNWSVDFSSQFYAFKKLSDARKFIRKRLASTLVATRFGLPTIKAEREKLKLACPEWYKYHENLNQGCDPIPYN